MKRRFLIVPVLALAVSASSAMAQQAPPSGPPPGGMGGGGGMGRGPGGAQRRMAMLMEGITLTPAQQASVDSIMTAFQGRMPAFTPGAPPDSASMAQRRELGQQRDAAIRAVLTADQQRVFDTNVQNMQANMPRRP